ncbi:MULTISPECIES: hypothetical protein [Vibrio]|uniref:hypothetical protein n=1 Tax=Vibrio TaxID=662 RepID=UPI0001B94E15|nr:MULTISPECIES: hypothetical protein [Vibrio]EEX33223.1 hypothetical protein VIC_002677 [Vibrio coralliilyticus ATCC BAA-450]MDE3897237.1 hypothetical protein [Vibrio sp. CC007]
MLFECLGFADCSYDPAKPTTYFGLGDLIAALGLAIAFWQLVTPLIKLRIKCHQFSKFAIGLSSLAIFSILIAAVLPSIPGTAIPLLGYPLFWEVSATVFILVSALIAWRAATTKVTLKDDNFQLYQRELFQALEGQDKGALFSIVDELSVPNIKYLAINYYCEHECENKRLAHNIIVMLSDEDITNNIVIHNPMLFYNLLDEFSRHREPDRGFFNKLVEELISASCRCENSFFYQSGKFQGIGIFNDNAGALIFGCYDFHSAYRVYNLNGFFSYGEPFVNRKGYWESYHVLAKISVDTILYGKSYDGSVYSREDLFSSFVIGLKNTIDLLHQVSDDAKFTARYVFNDVLQYSFQSYLTYMNKFQSDPHLDGNRPLEKEWVDVLDRFTLLSSRADYSDKYSNGQVFADIFEWLFSDLNELGSNKYQENIIDAFLEGLTSKTNRALDINCNLHGYKYVVRQLISYIRFEDVTVYQSKRLYSEKLSTFCEVVSRSVLSNITSFDKTDKLEILLPSNVKLNRIGGYVRYEYTSSFRDYRLIDKVDG